MSTAISERSVMVLRSDGSMHIADVSDIANLKVTEETKQAAIRAILDKHRLKRIPHEQLEPRYPLPRRHKRFRTQPQIQLPKR